MTTPRQREEASKNTDKVKTFLDAASQDGVREIRDLLESGANVNARGWIDERSNDDYEPEDDTRLTALPVAIQYRQVATIKLLISKGADVDAKVGDDTALLIAAHRGYSDIVAILIESGADITAGRFDGASALHEAVADSSPSTLDEKLQVINLLLDQGFDIETKDELGHTALHSAVFDGYLPLVKLLLERGANIKARNQWDDVPLDRAALGSRFDVVECLIDKGAEVNTAEGGCKGLGSAAGNGHAAVVRLLLDSGAKPLPDGSKDRQLELLCAARSGNVEVVNLLINRDFGDQATKALFRTVLIDSADVVKILVNCGANVKARNRSGQTPLHLAVLSQRWARYNVHGEINPRLNVVKLLLERGTDADVRDFEGHSAKDLAIRLGFSEAIELLTTRGA